MSLGPRHSEPLGAGQRDLGTNLEVQLERERFVFAELHVVHVGLGRELELLALHDLLVGLLNEASSVSGESRRRISSSPSLRAPCPDEIPGA
jgi:hypothetical protein